VSVSQSFRIKRNAVSIGVLTAIYPPCTCTEVSVENLTSADLQIHTNSDETEYVALAAGFARLIPVKNQWFSPSEIAFWLKPGASGTVVLLWY
jgi:hypothetical protein